MNSKIKNILEFLKIDSQYTEAAEYAIKEMISALKIDDMAEYSKNESGLFSMMGVGMVVESGKFSQADVQKLHDKIKLLLSYAANKNISSKTDIYEYYYGSGQASRDIDKIKAGHFKWDSLNESSGRVNKISKNDFIWDSTMVGTAAGNKDMGRVSTKDRKEPGEKKFKVVYYKNGMYNGMKVTDELRLNMMKKGIYLAPDNE